jgi:hypothetical protein
VELPATISVGKLNSASDSPRSNFAMKPFFVSPELCCGHIRMSPPMTWHRRSRRL